MRTLAVYSIKGGVGKTSTAVNLAYLSARSGARTLLWDLDPQGAATFLLRSRQGVRGGVKKLLRGGKSLTRFVRPTDYQGLEVLPADFSYRNLDLTLDACKGRTARLAKRLGPLADSYDHLYLDCAPSISLTSESIFEAADALLVPTIPTELSMRALEQLAQHLKSNERDLPAVPLLPFFSMVDRRKALHREISERRTHGPVGMLTSRIPYSSAVERMSVYRAPLPACDPTGELARAYDDLWSEILNNTGSLVGWFGQLRRKIGLG